MKKKKPKKTFGSRIVQDLEKLNAVIARGESVCDQFVCSRVVLNLQPRDYSPEMVKNIRKTLRVSQAIFAQFLGVSASTIKSWEQGQNHAPGMARRVFDEISNDPSYWRARLQASIVDKSITDKLPV